MCNRYFRSISVRNHTLVISGVYTQLKQFTCDKDVFNLQEIGSHNCNSNTNQYYPELGIIDLQAGILNNI